MNSTTSQLPKSSLAALDTALVAMEQGFEDRLQAVLTAYEKNEINFQEAERQVQDVVFHYTANPMIYAPSATTRLAEAHDAKISQIREWRDQGYINSVDALDKTLALAGQLRDGDMRRSGTVDQVKRLVLKPEALEQGNWEIDSANVRGDVPFFNAARGLSDALAGHFRQCTASETEFPKIHVLFQRAHQGHEQPPEVIAYALVDATEKLVRIGLRESASNWGETHPLRIEAHKTVTALFDQAAITEAPPVVLSRAIRVEGLQSLNDIRKQELRAEYAPVIMHCLNLAAAGNGDSKAAHHALRAAAFVIGDRDNGNISADWIMQNGTTPPEVFEKLLLAHDEDEEPVSRRRSARSATLQAALT